jgi:YHYH protein/Concanavalin A-like lectin/glucanases superfamily
MAINKTIDLLPEYLQTVPNQRFLNSTLDRLVSDPSLRQFDGYVGRRLTGGLPLTGNYVTEPNAYRSQYQLEPEFVFKAAKQPTRSAGFKDVLNSVAAQGGISTAWNRLLTNNSYTYTGFVDLDKLTNYYNYVWIPESRIINGTRVDENAWFRTPVEVSNSAVSSNEKFVVRRTPAGFTVDGVNGSNPQLYLSRGGNYTFSIQPGTTSSRVAKTISQLNNTQPVTVSNEFPLFQNFSGRFETHSGLVINDVTDFNLKYSPFAIETWVWISSEHTAADQVIVGQWQSNDTLNSSWALMRTGTPNTLKFVWNDVTTGQQQQLIYDSGSITTNSWHHVAVTRSGSTARIYIDGYQVVSGTMGTLARSDKPLTVGSDLANQLAFRGFINDLRITTGYARYTNLFYELPTGQLINDAGTVLLLSFDLVQGLPVFLDVTEPVASRVWIQTDSGITGTIPTNPNITSRNVTGVSNNGITVGDIEFNVPNLTDESYWRSLVFNESLPEADLATELNFNQIDGKLLNTFVQAPTNASDSELTGHRGGIDGITDLDGKTLVFVNGQSAGWETVMPFEMSGVEVAAFEQTIPIPNSQWFGIWQIQVINGVIRLNYRTQIGGSRKIAVKNGNTYRNTTWYKVADNTSLIRMPPLSGNYSTIYLQDDQAVGNVLPLSIVNTEAPTINVSTDIIGKPYYTSGNGVEFIDGLRIKFGSNTTPAQYVNPVLVSKTSITAQLDNSSSTMNLLNTQQIVAGNQLVIDDETVLVLSVDDAAGSVTVERGIAGTTAAPHSAGSWAKIYTDPTYIVEGVGQGICLVPYTELTTSESYLDLAQNPDYITINRASLDRNPWSRTNRWFNRAVVEKSIQYLQAQGKLSSDYAYPVLNSAVRPIMEFRAGLKLYDFGIQALPQVDVLDNQINDALSNINGRRITDTQNLTLDGHRLVDGDLVIFNHDQAAAVREKIYQVQYVDVDGDLALFSKAAVKAAATGNVGNLATCTILDGQALNTGDRVLLWRQTNASENGIYTYTTGTGLSRSTDANSNSAFLQDFYVFVNTGTVNGNLWFKYSYNLGVFELGTTPIVITNTTNSGPVISLVEYASAVQGSCTVVKSVDALHRGTNWLWDVGSSEWKLSSQQKHSVQQNPVFDVYDYTGASFADDAYYNSTSFVGSTLVQYQRNDLTTPDPVLGFGITYRNLANVGDITFLNTYDTDTFVYLPDPLTGVSVSAPVNQGVVHQVDPLTAQIREFSPWTQVLSNLELYQTIQKTGSRLVEVQAQLLNKSTANNTQVWVDGTQLKLSEFTVQQVGDVVKVSIADSVLVDATSNVIIKLITATPVPGSYYDVPAAYQNNPYNQRPVTFTHNDFKQHTDAIYAQHGDTITSTQPLNTLNDGAHIGRPGLIMLHEGFSVLPTLMLTDDRFNIDRALKKAAADYEMFKLKFMQTAEMVENIENMLPKQAVDQIFSVLTANSTSGSAWNSSDMVPVGGTLLSYIVDDPQQTAYTMSTAITAVASNRAALVYLNKRQLIRGADYELFTGQASVKILTPLVLGDVLEIYEFSNTDGCGVPATPAKLGLGPAFVPSMYTDDTYQTPVLVIQGHDGSITQAFNDYRDALILELEQRIYNNIKVDSEFWNQVIQDRVPDAGRFREINGLATYSMVEQAQIQRKFFYEWVAENRVMFNTSVYDPDNLFTYNYATSTDKITGDFLLGYWRGCYRDFYDTDRPHSNPWEMLGFSIKPTWWESAYGPAPYTGENRILWEDVAQGIIRNTGEFSVLGPRNTNLDNPDRSGKLSVLDILPVSANGVLYSPNESLVAVLNTQGARNGFTFNDSGPAETAWRRSSTYAFARLRTKILQNPQFMLGVLWDLDWYRPTVRRSHNQVGGKFDNFRYLNTLIPSITDIQIQDLDQDSNGRSVRKHSILNYVTEYLRSQGQDASLFKHYIINSTVNLVYNLAGFADKGNLTVYADQNSAQTQQQSVIVPAEDYSLLLSQSVPVGQVIYSGVIITQTSTGGYRVSGYDQQYPFFIINPSKTAGGRTTSITVGSQTYVIYLDFEDQPIYIPYNYEFSSRQTVVDFLTSYGEYLKRQGFVFDTDISADRVNWIDAATQFVKWSYYNWAPNQGINRISLVLNPSSGVLTFRPQAGTLESLLNPGSLILDENQYEIDTRHLDVFRDADATYINNQQSQSVISALRANLVNYEHKLIINNQTVFNDLIYDPVLGIRQDRLRVSGIKNADWNGTLNSAGFLLMLSTVEDWQPNTDYLRGSIVRYKNQNWVATVKVLGASQFQQNNFSLVTTNFQDQLMPNIGAKALDLEHAYDPHYHNSIPDMVRLRCDALGYVERSWLSNLGLDLINQVEFYRGWIKQKGTPQALRNFTSAGTADLLADYTITEEYAVKMGDYGATGRTGYVEVALKNTTNSNNPVAVQFANGNNTSSIISVNNGQLFKKPVGWNPNIIQKLDNGNLQDAEMSFLDAGPVLPEEIYQFARNNTLEYTQTLESLLTYTSKSALTGETDTANLIKNIRNGNWIWIAINELSDQDNKYDVIVWKNSPARLVQIVKNTSNGTLDLYLDQAISVTLDDVVAVDLVGPTIQLQGVFTVSDYQVVSAGEYYSILRLRVDVNQYSFSSNSYAAETAPQCVFTYTSLRHSDLGSANLYSQTNRLQLPSITRAYVDNDANGFGVYDFREPYSTGTATVPDAGGTVSTSISQEVGSSLIWSGSPDSDSGHGSVILRSFSSEQLLSGSTADLAVHGRVYFSSRPNTLKLGMQVLSLGDGLVAATASDTLQRGQIYIMDHSDIHATTNQIFEADGFTAGDSNTQYASSLAVSRDSQWLVVGAPNPAGTGKVLVYRKLSADGTQSTTISGTGGATYTLSFIPAGVRSIRVLVDGVQLVPTLDYNISGSTLTLTTATSGNIVVTQLSKYYDLVQTISDPDAITGSEFGYSVSLSDDGSVLAVGSPKSGAGRAYMFNRDVQRSIQTSSGNTIHLASPVSNYAQVQLKVNGLLRTDYSTVHSGDTSITTTSTVPAGSLVQVDLLRYDLIYTSSGSAWDLEYGSAVAVNGNFVVISAPLSIQTQGSVTSHQQGRLELLALASSINQTLTIDTTSGFSPNGTNSLRINNWVVNGTTVADLVNHINALSQYTGTTAVLAGTMLTLTFTANKHVNGVVNVTTGSHSMSAATTGYQVLQSVDNTDLASSCLGRRMAWITPWILAVVENHTDFVESAKLILDGNTQFDSGSTVIYNGSTAIGQRLLLMQLLRTPRDYADLATDTVQLVRVKTIQYQRPSGVELFFSGNSQRLWVGNSLAISDTDNVQCYTNDNLLAGWTLVRQQTPTLDAHSIFRAWIYNPTNREKILDLDVVDVRQGLLPGAITQYLDYISSVDPAAYGVPQWRSGVTYASGSRVIYNNTVYTAKQQNSAIFFNTDFWSVDTAHNSVSNSSSLQWGPEQVGRTWFNTNQIRTVNYQQGELSDRISIYNTWFPGTAISVYEWVSSENPPAQWTGTGFADVNTPAVFDPVAKLWYFWVLNKTQKGIRHPRSAADLSEAIADLAHSGLPMISPGTSNSVILYNVQNLVDVASYVLHIDYVLTDHNNRIHSEFLLLSEDGSGKWLNTPIYQKLVDSLCGQVTVTNDQGVTYNLEVPDNTLNPEDRYGVSFYPRQSMFRNREAAVKIYFQQINQAIKSHAVTNIKSLDLIRARDPQPSTDHYDFTVPDRDTLLILNTADYAPGTRVLVLRDYAVANTGWSLVNLSQGTWDLVTFQSYDLSTYWQYQDWSSSDYVAREVDQVIAHIGYLPSVPLIAGQYLKILNNGDNNYAIYEVQSDLSLSPVYIQNGTIQFKPNLYDFAASGYGWNRAAFDNQGLDNDPATPINLILNALNQYILTGDLLPVAESAFFATLRYVLQEFLGIDWLFKTSFISVKHRVKNLNHKTNYRRDDEQFVQDYINETKPFHTRIREYVNVYSALDTPGVAVSDFDLPALYDDVWYKAQFYGSSGKLHSNQAQYFNDHVALAEENAVLFVGTNGLANHAMGPWGADQVNITPVAQNWVFALNQNPIESPTKYPVPVDGAIGIAVNGVPFYSVVAAETDTLNWQQDPVVTETYTINIAANNRNYIGPDAGNGYIAQGDAYVYRMNPTLIPGYSLDPTQHSPLLGFALDGNPIYGPFGYRYSNGQGGIIQNTSSYRLKTDPRLSAALFNQDPALGIINGSQYAEYGNPTGEYIQDWEYTPGLGTLDEHNGRFVVTPEYPYGTYAYFITVDPADYSKPVFPYIIGSTFYGVPTGLHFNFQGEKSVPVYTNGKYQMPTGMQNVNTDWSLRSPTGLFYNDALRLTQDVYSNWNQNHTYNLTGLQIADPGRGYTVTPVVSITGGGGSGATAQVTLDAATHQLSSVTLLTPGINYTSLPTVTLLGGFNVLNWARDVEYVPGDQIQYSVTGDFYVAREYANTVRINGVSHVAQIPAAVTHVVQHTTTSSANVTLDSVTGITVGQIVKGAHIVGTPLVYAVDSGNNIVTLDSVQSVLVNDTLGFGNTVSDQVRVDSVDGIVTGMVVTGDHVVGLPTVTNVYPGNSTVRLSSIQQLTNFDKLSFVSTTYDGTYTTVPVVSSANLLLKSSVQGAQISEPGTAHTVQVSTSASANVKLESVAGISTGLVVLGTHVTGAPTVQSIDTSNNIVTLSTVQSLVQDDVLTFGCMLHSVPNSGNIVITGDQRSLMTDQLLTLTYHYGNPTQDTGWTFLNATDPATPRPASVVPILTNAQVRKIDTTIKFDRLRNTVTDWNSNTIYASGETVRYDLNYFIAKDVAGTHVVPVGAVPVGDSADLYWELLTPSQVAETDAANRITALYEPTADMISNDLTQLLVGAEYSGVLVQGRDFTETYQIPTGQLRDQEDSNIANVSVQLDASLIGINMFSHKHHVAGLSSASFDAAGRYLQVDPLSADVSKLAAGYNDFTVEFWISMSTLNQNQVLFDSTSGVGNTDGIVISVNSQNQIQVTDNNLVSLAGGSITNNVWQHVAVERKFNTVSLYLDGYRVAQYSNDSYHANYDSTQLVLGANAAGAQASTGFMDELRITLDLVRYDSDTYLVPSGGFGRDATLDPYIDHVTLLYGFEGLVSEVSDITFIPQGFQIVAQDIGATDKSLILINSNLITLGQHLTTAGPQNLNEIPAVIMHTDGAGNYGYIDAGRSQDFNLGLDDFTVELWCNPDTTTATKTLFALANDYTVADHSLTLTVATSAGSNTFTVLIQNSVGLVNSLSFTTTQPGPYFVSVERHEQTLLLFLNGSLVATDTQATYSFGNNTQEVPLTISAASGGFLGYLADFRLTQGLSRHAQLPNYDTDIQSDFADQYLGVRSEDIQVDGSSFVNSISGSATEEHINGRLYDTLDIRVFSDTTLGTVATAFRMFKDMIGNWSFYTVPASATASLTMDLLSTDSSIYLTDVSGFLITDPTQGRGAVFVGGERILYSGVDTVNNRLTGLMRGTLGTGIPTVHPSGSRVESAGVRQAFPGNATTVGVARTVQDTVVSTVIKLDSVLGISSGMTVTGTGIVGLPTVLSTDTANNTVTLSSIQSLTSSAVMKFGDIVLATTQPFTQITTNSFDAYHKTWNTVGSSSAADGLGLQLSTTALATFLLSHPALLP